MATNTIQRTHTHTHTRTYTLVSNALVIVKQSRLLKETPNIIPRKRPTVVATLTWWCGFVLQWPERFLKCGG